MRMKIVKVFRAATQEMRTLIDVRLPLDAVLGLRTR